TAPLGSTNAEWDFCSGDLFRNFSATQVSTLSSFISVPRAFTMVTDGTSWYGFAHDTQFGLLYRIHFGDSLGNTIDSVRQVSFTSSTSLISSSAWSRLKFYKQGSLWYAFGINSGNVLVRFNFPAQGLSSNTISYSFFNNSNGLSLSNPQDIDL